MTVVLDAGRALAWRLRRHFLVPGTGAETAEQVVGRLVAVPATPTGSGDPELSIRLRLAADPGTGVVAAALADGRLIKTFAFRGATHLMTPHRAAVHLAVRCAGRQWELASWRSHYRLEPEDWPPLRALVRERAQSGPVTWADLAEAVAAQPRFDHLGTEFTGQNWTLLKPFMWQGDLCFGPTVDGRQTFQAPATNPLWPGSMALDEAGPLAVLAYLDGYAPATAEHLQYWLGEGLSGGRRRVAEWLARVTPNLTEVEIRGRTAFVRTEQVEQLRAVIPENSVLLLPGYDQWVLGPGTADELIVPAEQRPSATRGANVVLVGGRVGATWKRTGGVLEVAWPSGSPVLGSELETAADRLAALLDVSLDLRMHPATA